jgi:hypothetical protein
MSTKLSIFWDGKNHIYQECFDEKSIFIERETDDTKILLELNLTQVLSIVRCMNYERFKQQSELTDEQIKNHVVGDVEHRINSSSNTMIELHGALIYGLAKYPKELQIQRGMDYYTTKRNYLKKIIDEIESSRANWPFHFGLEELIQSEA